MPYPRAYHAAWMRGHLIWCRGCDDWYLPDCVMPGERCECDACESGLCRECWERRQEEVAP